MLKTGLTGWSKVTSGILDTCFILLLMLLTHKMEACLAARADAHNGDLLSTQRRVCKWEKNFLGAELCENWMTWYYKVKAGG